MDFSSVEDHQSYSFNMKTCILVLALAVAAQAQFEPAKCDWEKEMVCPGMWDSETGKQTSPDTCMPMKNGDCMNHCPVDCGKDMLCPGKMDPNGCKMPDACAPGKFCPAECGEKEMMCQENGMKTGLNKCLVIIVSQTKLEIVLIIAQWIVVKICFAQEKWIPRVARCLIHVFQENFALLSVMEKKK